MKTDTPVVATNDVRFLKADEFDAHEVRVCIHEGRTLDDPRRARVYTAQQYLRSPEEMVELFEDIPEALENTVEIARRCTCRPRGRLPILPQFVSAGEGASAEEQLAAEVASGEIRPSFIRAILDGDRVAVFD